MDEKIILYTSEDGNSRVTLNQLQMAELFATSKQNVGQHIANILKDR